MKLRNVRRAGAILVLSLILGCHDGYAALFQSGQARPMKVFPYPIAALPAKDQALLKQGIPIETEEELRRLLQDYLS